MDIYLARGEERKGPYSKDSIRQFLADGVLDGTEGAWREGLDAWVTVREVVEGATSADLLETAQLDCPKIFISYRREDCQGSADWLNNLLEEHFPAGNVFFDLDSINPGRNYVEYLDEQVSQCDVLLALIGLRWVNAENKDGGKRLFDENDFVRKEIISAMDQGITVIPVLVERAEMPTPDQLPEVLAKLCDQQFAKVRPSPDFKKDVAKLIKELERIKAAIQNPGHNQLDVIIINELRRSHSAVMAAYTEGLDEGIPTLGNWPGARRDKPGIAITGDTVENWVKNPSGDAFLRERMDGYQEHLKNNPEEAPPGIVFIEKVLCGSSDDVDLDDPELIPVLGIITRLVAADAGITDRDLISLSKLVNLESLHLQGNRIRDLSRMSGLKQLQRIRLDRNLINNLEPLSDLGELKLLSLDGNQVSNLAPLKSLTSLEKLDLKKNPRLALTHIVELQRALPKCNIIHDEFCKEDEEMPPDAYPAPPLPGAPSPIESSKDPMRAPPKPALPACPESDPLYLEQEQMPAEPERDDEQMRMELLREIDARKELEEHLRHLEELKMRQHQLKEHESQLEKREHQLAQNQHQVAVDCKKLEEHVRQTKFENLQKLEKPEPAVESMPGQTSVERVTFSAMTPYSVACGTNFILDIWASTGAQQLEQVRKRAKELGRENMTGDKSGLDLAHGTVLEVSIDIPGFEVIDKVDRLVWYGNPVIVSFPVSVSAECRLGDHTGTARIHSHGLLFCKLHFAIKVAADAFDEPFDGLTGQQHIKSAFACHAEPDEVAMLARVQGMEKANPYLEVAYAKDFLKSGQDWKERIHKCILETDVLYLFWSKAASESENVKDEWRWAYDHKGVDFIDPVPLVNPHDVPPPPELNAKHFNDRYLALIETARYGKHQN